LHFPFQSFVLTFKIPDVPHEAGLNRTVFSIAFCTAIPCIPLCSNWL